MKRLTTFLLGLSILMPFGFTLQAIDKSDISALKKIGTRWNISFIPDYTIPVSGKDGPQISLVGSIGAAGVGYKAGHWITDMIKSSPKKADEFLKEHTNVKGALDIGNTLLQNITPFPWAFRNIKELLKEYTWFENTQNLLTQPVTWGVVGGGFLAWYTYSKLYRYTKDGLIKDAQRCVEILNRNNNLNIKINQDESNLGNVLGEYIINSQNDYLILDALKEWKLVLSIIDPLIKNYKNTLSKSVQQDLKNFKEVISHNYMSFTTGKWKRFHGIINAEANKKNSDAQGKMANAQSSMAKTAWLHVVFNALFKTGKFFITNNYGRAMLVLGMGAVGLNQYTDIFNK